MTDQVRERSNWNEFKKWVSSASISELREFLEYTDDVFYFNSDMDQLVKNERQYISQILDNFGRGMYFDE